MSGFEASSTTDEALAGHGQTAGSSRPERVLMSRPDSVGLYWSSVIIGLLAAIAIRKVQAARADGHTTHMPDPILI